LTYKELEEYYNVDEFTVEQVEDVEVVEEDAKNEF
jgi:hypothetical protein